MQKALTDVHSPLLCDTFGVIEAVSSIDGRSGVGHTVQVEKRPGQVGQDNDFGADVSSCLRLQPCLLQQSNSIIEAVLEICQVTLHQRML